MESIPALSTIRAELTILLIHIWPSRSAAIGVAAFHSRERHFLENPATITNFCDESVHLAWHQYDQLTSSRNFNPIPKGYEYHYTPLIQLFTITFQITRPGFYRPFGRADFSLKLKCISYFLIWLYLVLSHHIYTTLFFWWWSGKGYTESASAWLSGTLFVYFTCTTFSSSSGWMVNLKTIVIFIVFCWSNWRNEIIAIFYFVLPFFWIFEKGEMQTFFYFHRYSYWFQTGIVI